MKERLVEYLICPQSGKRLKLRVNKYDQDEILEGLLISPDGVEYPICRGIPRFVSSEEYTKTFGFQWNRHARIYFDDKDQRRVYSTYYQLQQNWPCHPTRPKMKWCLMLVAERVPMEQRYRSGEPVKYSAWI